MRASRAGGAGRRGPGRLGHLRRTVLPCVVLLLGLLAQGCGTGRPGPGPVEGGVPQITTSGAEILRGGEPWWFLGYNSFVWSGNCGHPDELMSAEQVDAWFASMRHDGHGAVRLFFFEGWDIDRLDAAVASAKRNGIYLTITLANGNADCGETEKDAAWFADPARRAAYVDHMTMLLTRYKGENTIAWFEYFNEPGYADGELRRFYDEMGAIADGIDPARLFSSGTVAPYWLGGPDNFRDVHESPGVDIASLHEYDYGEPESHHGPPTRANAAGKPVVVGEFGVIDPRTRDTECRTAAEQRPERVLRKATAYLDEGYAGAFAWAWQPGSSPDACEGDSIDTDTATQEVLRTATR